MINWDRHSSAVWSWSRPASKLSLSTTAHAYSLKFESLIHFQQAMILIKSTISVRSSSSARSIDYYDVSMEGGSPDPSNPDCTSRVMTILRADEYWAGAQYPPFPLQFFSKENLMPGRQAKTITPTMLRRMLAHVAGTEFTARDRVIILLSVKAGLRACEIARLDWSMVLDPRGQIGNFIEVRDAIAKMRGGRRVPLHTDLRRALVRLKARRLATGPIIKSTRGGPMKPNSIVNWFVALFDEIGFEGCSSHSGRRTFITNAARNVHRTGCSLRDVQLLAGHKSIQVTQAYIDGQTSAQRRLVALSWCRRSIVQTAQKKIDANQTARSKWEEYLCDYSWLENGIFISRSIGTYGS
jgi:integrase